MSDETPTTGASGGEPAANPLAVLAAFFPSTSTLGKMCVVAAGLYGYWNFDAISGVVGSFRSAPVAPVETVSKDDVALVRNSVTALGATVDELKLRLAGTESKIAELTVGLESVRTKSDAPPAKSKGITTGSIKRLKAPVEGSRELPIH